VAYFINFSKVSKIDQRRDGAGPNVIRSPPCHGNYRTLSHSHFLSTHANVATKGFCSKGTSCAINSDAQAFDFALLDINLNGSNSHPVAEALMARGVPLVYSTGNSDHGSRDGYSDRPVLRKPFKYEELVAILTRLKLAPVE